ncbi:MAG: type I glutamate--ammonia ligase [Anaerolineales bacterium]
MFETYTVTRQYIEEHEIQAIDLKFCDLWGRSHHITIPAREFSPSLMEEGIGFDGSAVGLKNVKAGDMVMVPDLATGFLDPFWEVPTLSFLCNALNATTMNIFPNDPRNIARGAESYLRSTGVSSRSLWGPEFEFYVFDQVHIENKMHRAGYRFTSYETEHPGPEGHSGGTYIPLQEGYHASPPKDQHFNFRQEITQHLQEMNIPVKYHHHEVGSFGQMEIETPLLGLDEAGDAITLIKYATKMVATQHGKSVTFMPKPIYGEAGNGMHFHQQLFKEQENLFYDPDGYGNLSETARHYIAGLLQHGPALLALTNPSTNSYRRLVPGFEAPVNAFYSLGNRSAAIRIPKYAKGPQTARIEFRPPDATSNPYLTLAAQLLAGLDGIQKALDPTKLGFGPIDEDIFSWPEEKRKTIQPLPSSLEDALLALEKDHDFLLAGDVFSEELIADWIEHKRKKECVPVKNRPHPYEMHLYFDV